MDLERQHLEEERLEDDPEIPVRQQPQAMRQLPMAQQQQQAAQQQQQHPMAQQQQPMAQQQQPMAQQQQPMAQQQLMLQQPMTTQHQMYLPPGPSYVSAWPQPTAAMAAFYPPGSPSSPAGAGAAYYMPQQSQAQSPTLSPAMPAHPQFSPAFMYPPSAAAGSPAQEQPSFNLGRLRSNLRSTVAPRVTLPWERRERAGRPNSGEALLKNLYDLGLIQPGAAAAQQPAEQPAVYQRCAFPAGGLLYNMPLGQVQIPPQVGLPQLPLQPPQAGVSLQNQPQAAMHQLPVQQNQPQAGVQVSIQNAAQAPASVQNVAAAQSSDINCVVCRAANPDGVMSCGHPICCTCFVQQLAVKPECPNPRCKRELRQDSFISFKKT